LGEIGDPATIPLLVEASHEDDLEVSALLSLARIGGPAVTSLLDLVSDEHGRTRPAVVTALAHTRDLRVVPALLEALSHWHWDVRGTASRGLLEIGPPALRLVLAAVRDLDRDRVEGPLRCGERRVMPPCCWPRHCATTTWL
jgi:HEAT repeat protein